MSFVAKWLWKYLHLKISLDWGVLYIIFRYADNCWWLSFPIILRWHDIPARAFATRRRFLLSLVPTWSKTGFTELNTFGQGWNLQKCNRKWLLPFSDRNANGEATPLWLIGEITVSTEHRFSGSQYQKKKNKIRLRPCNLSKVRDHGGLIPSFLTQ